ncbi:MAG: anthranilate synthase component I family protein [Planctomycetota bacterium]
MLIGPRRQLDWGTDPLALVARWPQDRALAVLSSGRTNARWSRWSVLAEPSDVGVTFDADNAKPGLQEVEARVTSDDAPWLGYFAYDVAYGLERVGSSARNDHSWPAAALRRCPGWLLHDRVEGRWWAGGDWVERPNWIDALPTMPACRNKDSFGTGPMTSGFTEPSYREAVRRCLDYIAAGDVFQVNLTQRFAGPFAGDPRAAFLALTAGSPAWYGAYLEWPADDVRSVPALALASISPELLLELRANGALVTRPIKGTRPAEAELEALKRSTKDAAELAMIVDLLRNDLGRVCGYRTVQVDEARTIERHPTVQHGVATVSGRRHGSCGLADVLRAVLPGGSITGAPKVRAMQIIDELEPVRRGPYCGAVGWLQGGASGGVAGALNVAIRTALFEQPDPGVRGRVSFGVGGGIVADSVPAAEYEETLVKASAVRAGLARGRMAIPSERIGSRSASQLVEF